MPRRINAWCDLSLVVGFAEGRHEIDGGFIDLVIAAQRGTLEGMEDVEPKISRSQEVIMEKADPADSGSVNGLKAEIRELVGRLTRVEGLVLEMTSQLIPVVATRTARKGFSLGRHPKSPCS